jgi:hypothetical protein
MMLCPDQIVDERHSARELRSIFQKSRRSLRSRPWKRCKLSSLLSRVLEGCHLISMNSCATDDQYLLKCGRVRAKLMSLPQLECRHERPAPFYALLDLAFEYTRYRKIWPLLFQGLKGRVLDAGVGTGRNRGIGGVNIRFPSRRSPWAVPTGRGYPTYQAHQSIESDRRAGVWAPMKCHAHDFRG